MAKRVCWYCGSKSGGKTCEVCGADLDEQEAELAALNAQEEATGLLDMSPPLTPPRSGREGKRI